MRDVLEVLVSAKSNQRQLYWIHRRSKRVSDAIPSSDLRAAAKLISMVYFSLHLLILRWELLQGSQVTIRSCSKCLNCCFFLFLSWYVCPGGLILFEFSCFCINQRPFVFCFQEFIIISGPLMGSFLVCHTRL